MSYDGIKVQHGALSTGSGQVIKAAKDIRARLDELASQLNPLQSDWEGGAKQAYVSAKATWDKAIDEMVLLLESAGHGVEQSNSEYQQADKRGASRFGG